MNPLDMKYSDVKYTRSAGRFAVIAILVFVAVSVTAMVTLRSQADGATDGITASLTGYLAQVAEALGR